MSRALVVVLLLACGSPDESAEPAEPTEITTTQGSEHLGGADEDPNRAACAHTHIAFDLRALPAGSDEMLWVRGEADDLREVAVGSTPRVYGQLGASTLDVSFDAASDQEALEHCRATLAAYLPDAPRYPLAVNGRFESATSATPCSPCANAGANNRQLEGAPARCPAHYGRDAPSCEGDEAALECDYPQGTCSCGTPTWCGGAAPPPMPVRWMCQPHRSPCDAAGSACSQDGARCSSDACGWSGVHCVNGRWQAFRSPPPA